MFGEVAAVSGGPFIMLLDEDRSSQAHQGFGIREHSDDIGTPLDLLIDPFERVGGPELTSVNLGEAGEREQVLLGLLHHCFDFR